MTRTLGVSILLIFAACTAEQAVDDGDLAGEGGGKYDDPATADRADAVLNEPLCYLPGGDGWIQASLFLEEEPGQVVLTQYVGGMFDGGATLGQLRTAGAENGLDSAALDALNAVRVRFDAGQCYVAPDAVGLLVCTVYDTANQPSSKFQVDFLDMDGAGVWGPATATVLGTATTWVSISSTIKEITYADQANQSHARYYAGNDFTLTFARPHTSGGIVNFADVVVAGAGCEN